MNRLFRPNKTRLACVAAALLLALSPAAASAQSVKGEGTSFYDNGVPDGGNYFEHIAVNAWLDDDGVAHGTVAWIGDTFIGLPGNVNFWGLGGPADPFILDVTDLYFDGRTAVVGGFVTASPGGQANGGYFILSFTDNSGTDEPDEINGSPIDVGQITVRD